MGNRADIDINTSVQEYTVQAKTVETHHKSVWWNITNLYDKTIDEGAKHLCKIEHLIREYNKKEVQCPLRLPDLKIVITGTQSGYKREDGVFVVPIGCLKDW